MVRLIGECGLASPTDSTMDFDPHYSEVIRVHEIVEARDDALEALAVGAR